MVEAMIQMNVRIDPTLKRTGDRVLEIHGVTPSQAIRGLYESLSDGGKRANKALEVVSSRTQAMDEGKAKIEQEIQAIRDIRSSVLGFYEKIGFAGYDEGERPSDKELLEDALWERMQEKGMVSA